MSDAQFKHIAVTAAEDDDVVIMAGARPAAEAGSSDDGEGAFDQRAVVEALAPIGDDSTADQDSLADEAPASQPAAARSPKRDKDPYRETTMEDLESGPMPTAQRIVIIAAVVCIIGALIYYFVFMR